MNLTPIEIEQAEFSNAWKGYNPQMVRSFLARVASQVTSLNRDNKEKDDQIRKLEAELDRARQQEDCLRDALVAAQKMSKDIEKTANKKAGAIIAEAEISGEKIVQDAYQRFTEIMDDIRQLKWQRNRFEDEVRGIINFHQNLLSAITEREEEEPPLEDSITSIKVQK